MYGEAERIIKRWSALDQARSTWISHWQEIAERVLPEAADFYQTRSPGEKRTEKLFDSTAAMGLKRFSAAMNSMLTPRSQRWHGITTGDDDLNELPEVREYLEQVADTLFRVRYSARSLFASQQNKVYKSLGAFGTGCLYLDDDPAGRRLRYQAIHLSEVCIAENEGGEIDTVYRKFRLTARQVRQAWPEASLPPAISRALDAEPDKKFDFYHAVEPNEERDDRRSDATGMAWRSTYVSVEGRQVMGRGGYRTMPYVISREEAAPREIYGRAPAMVVLPDIKMLNAMSQTVIRSAQRAAAPPILVHDDGVLGRFNVKPDAVNAGAVSSDGRPLAIPFNSGSRVDISLEMMDQRRGVVNDAFLVTLFQILVETPQMTATEVLERMREKGALLAPSGERIQSEGLGPLIEREADLLEQAGQLPARPPVLDEAGASVRVQFDAPLNRAQLAEEGVGFARTVEVLLPLAQFQPEIMDNLDGDESARRLARINGADRYLRDEDARDALRADRAQQQELASTVGLAREGAGAVKDLAAAGSAAA